MAKIKKNILGINYLNGWMRAARIDSSEEEQGWSADGKIEDIAEIGDALIEAVKVTNSAGYYASFVIDHEQLLHKSIGVPPMKAKDLFIYIKRKVDQFKAFPEEASFSYTTSYIKKNLYVSINYMPRPLLEWLRQGCLDADLYLGQVMPFARVRARQLKELDIKDNEMAALIVRMFDKVSFIIGKKDGAIFSERSLKANIENAGDIERMTKEVKRSLLFSKQQFGESVGLVKLSKRFEENFFESIKKSIDVNVEWLPSSKRFYWIAEVLKMPFSDGGNLIARKSRTEISVRKYSKIAVIMVAVLWISSISVSIGISRMLHNKTELLMPVGQQIKELERSREQWREHTKELDQLRFTAKLLKDARTPPVTGWFTGYLCNEIPDGLIITRVIIEQVENRCKVFMEGRSLKGHKIMGEDLKTLSNNLKNGPFKMQMNDEWYKIWLKQLKEGIMTNDAASNFKITGVFKSK